MARRSRKPLPTGRIRFISDYNHPEGDRTTAYKKGMVLEVPPTHRKAALAKGKAVEAKDGQG